MSKVLLGDVARERKETCKGSKDGYPIVGLEHLTPEEITLSAWDEDKENTFTKLFRKGDVLFGRRRAYLKKAAVAPFDGICSGDITVIEAIPEKILPELLPFIIQNDALFDFAVGKSAGSLSPRVKWEHLKNYSFELPDMEEQHRLAKVLWAMDATKKTYQKLIQKTDELVKSQFIALITGATNTSEVLLEDISQFVTVGIANSATHAYAESGIIMFRNQNIHENWLDTSDLIYINPEFAKKYHSKSLEENDILVTRTGYPGIACVVPAQYRGCQTFTTLIVRLKPSPNINPHFICYYINSPNGKAYVDKMKVGVAQQNFGAKVLEKMPILLPEIDLQNSFLAFAMQSDKSKFELEQALAELTATYKRIIAENLG